MYSSDIKFTFYICTIITVFDSLFSKMFEVISTVYPNNQII